MATRLIEQQYVDRSLVGKMGVGTYADRYVWNSTTVDSSAPTQGATDGYELSSDRRALITVSCTGGTNATFTVYFRDGGSGIWAALADYGTAGSYQVSAGDTHSELCDLPAGADRLHVQLTAKTGSPTACQAWACVGH